MKRCGPTPWRRIGLGASLLVACGLVAGCGGAEEGGTKEFRQNFEKPATDQPRPKEKPETSKASKELSPRERRAQNKEG
jgi:hypothetical protein